MRSALATVRIPRPPARPPEVGVCRVCGCSELDPCLVAVRPGPLGPPVGEPCSWVDPSLCSRCHGPRRPTMRQAGELIRIRSRYGRIRVRAGLFDGDLIVELFDYRSHALEERVAGRGSRLVVVPIPTPELVLGPDGRIRSKSGGPLRPMPRSAAELEAEKAAA